MIPGITDTAQPRGELSDNELYAREHAFRSGASASRRTSPRPSLLLGEDSAYMTGQSIAVNGGAMMLP